MSANTAWDARVFEFAALLVDCGHGAGSLRGVLLDHRGTVSVYRPEGDGFRFVGVAKLGADGFELSIVRADVPREAVDALGRVMASGWHRAHGPVQGVRDA